MKITDVIAHRLSVEVEESLASSRGWIVTTTVPGYQRRLDVLPAFVTGMRLDELLRSAAWRAKCYACICLTG